MGVSCSCNEQLSTALEDQQIVEELTKAVSSSSVAEAVESIQAPPTETSENQVVESQAVALSKAEVPAEVEAFYAETKSLLEANAVPEVPSSTGWQDISKPSAKVFLKSKAAPARDCVYFHIQSQDQVPKLPMLEVAEGKITCGAIPTVWATKHWPLWFPFCDSVEMLRFYSPTSMLVQVKLKVLFVTLDFVLFLGIKDLIDTKGFVEVVFRSPPEGSEGKEWMGITVPPLAGSLPRICIAFAGFKAYPKTETNVEVEYQAEMLDTAGAPQWIKIFIFQQLSIRIIPELVKFQQKIPGSPLHRYLNSELTQESRDFLFGLHKKFQDHLARRTA
mmetsp:Transcript_853/g.1671  ORF Transcript_853/g.1671 Transcript_853/m.1671 type:complete len:333 (+) Transcript_853:29-1027(+)